MHAYLQILDVSFAWATFEIEKIWRVLATARFLEVHLLLLGYTAMLIGEKQCSDRFLPYSTLSVWGVRGEIQPG